MKLVLGKVKKVNALMGDVIRVGTDAYFIGHKSGGTNDKYMLMDVNTGAIKYTDSNIDALLEGFIDIEIIKNDDLILTRKDK